MKIYPRGNGYLAVYLPSHHRASTNGLVYEHIVIAENKLGRKLKDGEVVHHEDENKHNNNEDNLSVFKSTEDHNRFHETNIRILIDDYYISPPLKKNCEFCDKEYIYTESKNKTRYCSNKCRNEASRKVSRPSKLQLSTLIKEKSLLQIGKDYGVSDNAVRKWLKSYELPYKKEDIKKYKPLVPPISS